MGGLCGEAETLPRSPSGLWCLRPSSLLLYSQVQLSEVCTTSPYSHSTSHLGPQETQSLTSIPKHYRNEEQISTFLRSQKRNKNQKIGKYRHSSGVRGGSSELGAQLQGTGCAQCAQCWAMCGWGQANTQLLPLKGPHDLIPCLPFQGFPRRSSQLHPEGPRR